MSLVVSIGGKIESYYSFKKSSLNPVTRSAASNKVIKHEDSQESLNKHGTTSKKSQHLIEDSYGKQKEKLHHRVSRVFARDVMSSPVHTMKKNGCIRDAFEILNKHRCRHLLVLENKLIVGIISDRDLMSCSYNQESLDAEVSKFMTCEVILAKEDADIRVLANIMLTEGISSIPIIDDNYLLKGIVTHTDLLRCLMNNMPLDVVI